MNEPTDKKRYYGKYRGMVIDNVDPMRIGRCLVQVPDVFGLGVSSWAMPNLPFGGIQAGLYSPPNLGACVWIEFEQGDPDKPVLAGAYFSNAGEVPAMAQATPPEFGVISMVTQLQNQFTMSDTPGPTGGFQFLMPTGAGLIINDIGVFLTDGKGGTITIIGGIVAINETALTVLPVP